MYKRTKIALCTRIVVALFRNSKRLVPLLTLSIFDIFTVKSYGCNIDLNGTSSGKSELAKILIPLQENCRTVLSKLSVITQKIKYCNTKINDTLTHICIDQNLQDPILVVEDKFEEELKQNFQISYSTLLLHQFSNTV